MNIHLFGCQMDFATTAETTQSFFEKVRVNENRGRYYAISNLAMGGVSALYDTCSYTINAFAHLLFQFYQQEAWMHCKQQITNALRSFVCFITIIPLCLMSIADPKNAKQIIKNQGTVLGSSATTVSLDVCGFSRVVPQKSKLATAYFIKAKQTEGLSTYALLINLLLGCTTLFFHIITYSINAIFVTLFSFPYDPEPSNNFQEQGRNAFDSAQCCLISATMIVKGMFNPQSVVNCIGLNNRTNVNGTTPLPADDAEQRREVETLLNRQQTSANVNGTTPLPADDAEQQNRNLELLLVMDNILRFEHEERDEIHVLLDQELESLSVSNFEDAMKMIQEEYQNYIENSFSEELFNTLKQLLAKLIVYTGKLNDFGECIEDCNISFEIGVAQSLYDEEIKQMLENIAAEKLASQQRIHLEGETQDAEFREVQREEARIKLQGEREQHLVQGRKFLEKCNLYKNAVEEVENRLNGAALASYKNIQELARNIDAITRRGVKAEGDPRDDDTMRITEFLESGKALFQDQEEENRGEYDDQVEDLAEYNEVIEQWISYRDGAKNMQKEEKSLEDFKKRYCA